MQHNLTYLWLKRLKKKPYPLGSLIPTWYIYGSTPPRKFIKRVMIRNVSSPPRLPARIVSVFQHVYFSRNLWSKNILYCLCQEPEKKQLSFSKSKWFFYLLWLGSIPGELPYKTTGVLVGIKNTILVPVRGLNRNQNMTGDSWRVIFELVPLRGENTSSPQKQGLGTS